MTQHPDWYGAAYEAARAVGRRVFLRRDFELLLEALKADGAVPRGTSVNRLLAVLEETGGLREETVRAAPPAAGAPPSDRLPYRPVTRYVLGEATAEELAVGLRPRSYLSHRTALRLHGLLTGPASPVYVNQEQSEKPAPTGGLTQEGIDRAFANAPRASKYVYRYQHVDLVLLAGKQTRNYGVEPLAITPDVSAPVTSVARSLVDAAVRPAYADGAPAVLDAYRAAVRGTDDQVALRDLLGRLVETLDALGHMYPYHQAVGFYLERAGVSTDALRPLAARGLSHDFYLEHRMTDAVLDPVWRVYVPRALAAE